MADEGQGQKPEEKPTGQPQAGGDVQKPQTQAEPETFSREYVEELRRENAKYRTERNDFKTKLDDAEAKKLEEQGKFKELADQRAAELEDLKLKRREDAVQAAVRLEALKMGFNDPNDAYTAADLSKVKVGEMGDVSGVQEAIVALVAAKPYLVKSGKGAPGLDAGAGGQSRPERTITLTDEQKRLAQYAGMTEEQYIKYLTMPSSPIVPDAGGPK